MSMLGRAFSDFAYLPASDTRGGILIAGRQQDVALTDILLGCYSITVSITSTTQSEGAVVAHRCIWATGRR